MEQQISTPTPFQTHNFALAVTLRICGIDWERNDKGQAQPCYNVYTPDILRKLGYKGMTPENAVRSAVRNHQPGTVIYSFTKSPAIPAILDGFTEMEQAIKEADKNKGDTTTLDPGVTPETVAKICCQFAKTRKELVNVWKLVPPMLEVQGDSKTEQNSKGGVTITGSYKLNTIKL